MNYCVCFRRGPRLGAGLMALIMLVASVAIMSHGVAPSAAATGSVESANARYLVASYQQFLGRDPADAGLDFHLNRLASGGDESRERVARSLLYGSEGSANEVARAYQSLLRRDPEPKGGAYWTEHLRTNDVLDLRVLLLSSDEYHRRSGGTDQSWVAALYRDVLGRSAEPAGLAYWSNQASRGVSRSIIVSGFYLGRESLGLRTDSYYHLTLDRTPTAVERAEGIALIAAEGERALYARLWASDERFEPFFDLGWQP